jgi:hypothetical protein
MEKNVLMIVFLKTNLYGRKSFFCLFYNLVLQLQCCNKIITNQKCTSIEFPHVVPL